MTTTVTTTDRPMTEEAWRGFVAGPWQDGIDVRDFIQRNYTPYTGDAGFLAGPTAAHDRAVGEARGDVPGRARARRLRHRHAHAGARSPSHAPGLHRQGQRADRRAADRRPAQARDHAQRRLAHGRGRARDLRLRGRPDRQEDLHAPTARPTTTACSTSTRRGSRPPAGRSIITGLPDAYGRGRIIGDYRRVALYGVDALIAAKKRDRAELDLRAVERGRDPRPRGERRADPRPAASSRRWPPPTATTSPARPAPPARPCSGSTSPTWRAVKEQNGAAMSLGRTSTFLDVYLQRDLDAGLLTEQQAQELVDDLVIKLRIVRFLRTPAVRRAVLRRPDLGHRVDRRHGRGRPHPRHPHVVPVPADPLQPRAGPGAEPDGVVERPSCPRRSSGSARRSRSTPRRSSTSRDELIRASVRRRRRDRLLRVGDARRQADAVLRRPGQPRQDAALRDQRRARRDHRRAGGPARTAGRRATCSTTTTCVAGSTR